MSRCASKCSTATGPCSRVHGAQEGQRDRVVAADHDEPVGAARASARAPASISAHGLGDVERVGDDVAGIGDLLGAEREHVLRGVVRPQQARRLAHVRGTEARAGPVADAAVEGHADDRDVRATDLVEPREAREGGDAGESRHDARIDRAAESRAARRRRAVGLHIRNFRYCWATIAITTAAHLYVKRALPPPSREERACARSIRRPTTAARPIGAKLRSTRIAQGLTLAQVAETTGLSKGFLSRVERDETSPSVATLVQLCQVLSLPVGALFAEPEIQRITRADAPHINLGGVGADELLMSPRGEQRVQLLRSTLEPDAHGGHELYTINATSRCCT